MGILKAVRLELQGLDPTNLENGYKKVVSLIGGMTGLSAKLIKPVMTNCGIGIPWRREDQENRLLKSKSLQVSPNTNGHFIVDEPIPFSEKHIRKVANTSNSGLEAPPRFYRSFVKETFDVYLLGPFGEKLISQLEARLFATLCYAIST